MTSAPSAARVRRAGTKRATSSPKVVKVAGAKPAVSADVAVGRRVLLMEANGLAAMAAQIDGAFTRAVDVMMAVSGSPATATGIRGRVIVSGRSEEHTSELQSLMRISYAVFCLKKKKHKIT